MTKRQRIAAALAASCVALLTSPLQGTAQQPPASATAIVKQIGPGVEMIQEILPEGVEGGPQVVTLFKVDPRKKGVRVEAALGQDRVWGTDPTLGREVVSALAARRRAAAAVNAGFFTFNGGHPLGLHVQGGEMVTEPGFGRSVFYLNDKGKAGIEAFAWKGSVQAGSEAHPLHGLNRLPRPEDDLLLFTPVFFDATLRSPRRVETVLEGVKGPLRPGRTYTGKVTRVTEGGRTPIAQDTVVLSAAGSAVDYLRRVATPGATLKIQLDAVTTSGKPFDITTLREAIAGGPRLLRDGAVDIPLKDEGVGIRFSQDRHPRTAIGITREGTLLFLTVDGRQTGLSRGISLPEIARLLLKYGAVEAVNMDGGGSSTAIVQGSVVNSPSGGHQRPVANAFLIFAPEAEEAAAPGFQQLAPPPRPLQVGEVWDFVPRGRLISGIWGTKGAAGFVNQKGVFRALRPGVSEVRLYRGVKAAPLTATVTVTVPSPPAPLQPAEPVQKPPSPPEG